MDRSAGCAAVNTPRKTLLLCIKEEKRFGIRTHSDHKFRWVKEVLRRGLFNIDFFSYLWLIKGALGKGLESSIDFYLTGDGKMSFKEYKEHFLLKNKQCKVQHHLQKQKWPKKSFTRLWHVLHWLSVKLLGSFRTISP